MQLCVMGSKLKRLTTWSIWLMVENSGFQADLRNCEWNVRFLIAIHSTIFLYQCNLITHNMGQILCSQLNTHGDACRSNKRLQEYKSIKQHPSKHAYVIANFDVRPTLDQLLNFIEFQFEYNDVGPTLHHLLYFGWYSTWIHWCWANVRSTIHSEAVPNMNR